MPTVSGTVCAGVFSVEVVLVVLRARYTTKPIAQARRVPPTATATQIGQ
jgi:hypothetical protein